MSADTPRFRSLKLGSQKSPARRELDIVNGRMTIFALVANISLIIGLPVALNTAFILGGEEDAAMIAESSKSDTNSKLRDKTSEAFSNKNNKKKSKKKKQKSTPSVATPESIATTEPSTVIPPVEAPSAIPVAEPPPIITKPARTKRKARSDAGSISAGEIGFGALGFVGLGFGMYGFALAASEKKKRDELEAQNEQLRLKIEGLLSSLGDRTDYENDLAELRSQLALKKLMTEQSLKKAIIKIRMLLRMYLIQGQLKEGNSPGVALEEILSVLKDVYKNLPVQSDPS